MILTAQNANTVLAAVGTILSAAALTGFLVVLVREAMRP